MVSLQMLDCDWTKQFVTQQGALPPQNVIIVAKNYNSVYGIAVMCMYAMQVTYHCFSTFIRRRDITDDCKTQADIALANAANDTCQNKHREIMWKCPHSIWQCNSNLTSQHNIHKPRHVHDWTKLRLQTAGSVESTSSISVSSNDRQRKIQSS